MSVYIYYGTNSATLSGVSVASGVGVFTEGDVAGCGVLSMCGGLWFTGSDSSNHIIFRVTINISRLVIHRINHVTSG